MITKGKISAFQFFTMLFISRALTTVTYVSSYTKDVRLSDMLIQPIFRLVLGILIIIPVYLVYKKHGKSPLEVSRDHSQVFSKASALLYAGVFFYFTVTTLSRLDVFTGTVVFPETNVSFMLVFLVIFCCYGAYTGFEALGRSSVLTAILVIPAIAFILFALIDKMDLLNLSPVFYNGISPVVKTAVDSVGQTVEYAIIAVALPKVTGNIKKGFFVWLVAQIVLMALLFFFAGAVMGNFAGTQLFPFHALASLAEFTIFDRLDALFTSVWIMCAFIKASLLIFLQSQLICSVFSRLKPLNCLVIIGAFTILANLFIAKGINRFLIVDASIIKIILTGIAVVTIPVSVLFMGQRGKRKCARH